MKPKSWNFHGNQLYSIFSYLKKLLEFRNICIYYKNYVDQINIIILKKINKIIFFYRFFQYVEKIFDMLFNFFKYEKYFYVSVLGLHFNSFYIFHDTDLKIAV
jgi:hypothetical protein